MTRAARRRIVVLFAALGAGAWACASEQFPPGGPERKVPPKLLATLPETDAVTVSPKRVVFQFDEVVSELPSGVQNLADLFLVSPGDRKAPADVAWHRTHISLSPHRGFRPNTVYTFTLLPGLTDLYGNTLKTGFALTFSTGDVIPSTQVKGSVFDWVKGAAAPKAYVEAWVPPDTNTVWVTISDSSGRFLMEHLPAGHYLFRAYIDQNNNRKLDLREAWDSSGVDLKDSAAIEFDTFIHDTIGARIAEAHPIDSLTLRLTFDKGIDETQRIDPSLFTIKRKDSSVVTIAAAIAGRTYDSLTTARQRVRDDSMVRADSAKRAAQGGVGQDTTETRLRQQRRASRRDSASRARILHPSRPVPVTDAILTLAEPLQPATLYRINAIGLKNLLGHPRTSFIVLSMPKRDTTTTTDSTGRRVRKTPTGRAGARPGHAPVTPPSTPAPPPLPPATTPDTTKTPPRER